MVMRRLFGWLLVAFLAEAASPALAADAIRGEALYNSRCVACHSLDANRVGPKHRGVFGRKAGSLPDFSYSRAVEGAGVVWDDATLDRWLADPQAFIPGQRMNFRVADPTDRADLIAYLKTLR
jgi:cytochrome c